MTGKSHITMNVLSAVIVVDTFYVLDNTVDSLKPIVSNVQKFMFDNQSMPFVLFVILSGFLFFLGSLLPDIDHPYSTLGKIIHIPIQHRTWTHSIWLPAMLCIAGIYMRYLFWFGLAIFLHDFWDSFSASGINWFYPIINKHHIAKLYHTGKVSEYVIVGIFAGIVIVYTFLSMQAVYHFVNISF